MTKKTVLDKLYKKIRQYVISREKDFSLDDIMRELTPANLKGRPGFSQEDVLDILENSDLVFSKKGAAFVPRHLFFNKARFIVSPREDEIKDRILIPGHRFLPFHPHEVFPWDCTLRVCGPQSADSAGKTVPVKKIGRQVHSLPVYYTLYGQENMPFFLILDHEENEKAFQNKDFMDESVDVTAFDFAPFFEEWNFSPGDGLLLEVEDWAQGIFTVQYLPKKRRRELVENALHWLRKLEKGFLKVFDEHTVNFPLEEQISYAYYYAGPQVLREPALHLGGFFDSSPCVNFVTIGSKTRLWRENHIDLSALRLPDPPPPRGAGGSIDEIFRDLSVPVSEIEVEACMRDELFHRRENPQSVRERIIAGRKVLFFSRAQENEFDRHFKKLWNKIKKTYNYFSDQLSGKARERILKILDENCEWMDSLQDRKADKEDFPMEEVSSMGETLRFLIEQLEILNIKDPDRSADAQDILELLPEFEEFVENLRDEISSRFDDFPPHGSPVPPEGNQRPQLRLVKPGDPDEPPEDQPPQEAEKVYVFRIDLLSITPPIWRNFQVPGSFTLAELHEVILAVMGWEGYHAHSFTIKGQPYGTINEVFLDSKLNQNDEDDFTLDSLQLKEKQKFEYIYDFGDGWIHQISVTKVFPAGVCSKTHRTQALCLDGKRACPPEDCGGISGYASILEALISPGKKKNLELLDWLGDYDPEYFAKDEVNEILKG
ncbi:MAG: plasmid pRiA4b ORF-3 family protein [Spirochaetales bacterium]|jgi:hypothetical protein|nr:plasmid pRiA4b ORF-3 family protein [Spirochaetales bacterium]